MTDSSSHSAASPAIERYGVVAVILRGDCFLVIRRSQQVRAPGAYCFPGGHIEPGEDEPTALCREMREELGVIVEPRERLWHSVTPWGVSLAWWLTNLAEDEIIQAEPSEVESIHWLSAKEMVALPELLESNHHFLAAWERREFMLPIVN